jgi:hypothetical protein
LRARQLGAYARRDSAGSGTRLSSASGGHGFNGCEAEAFGQFLDGEKIAAEDRVIRWIALRGSASEGIAVSRTDLVPEVTITADGVYWHPVGAADADLLVARDIFPLSDAFVAVRQAFDREGDHANQLARSFNCA